MVAYYYLGDTDDYFIVDSDDVAVFAQGGNDTIEGFGSNLLLNGGRGSDQIGWVFGDDVRAFGGAGNDAITVNGQDNVLYGGCGDDHLRAEGQNASLHGNVGDDTIDAGYGTGLLAHGGLGADSITGACYESRLYGNVGNDAMRLAEGSYNRLFGGAGDDTLSGSTFECRDNTLRGGIGDDELTARDSRNALCGGPGDDLLSSIVYDTEHEAGDGTLLRGGLGIDGFYFEKPLHLGVTGDDNLRLSQDDVLTGGLDRIVDYQAGETIALFGDGYTRTDFVALVDAALEPHRHVSLAQQTWAVFRGDLSSPGVFVVSSTGDDKIILYSADFGQGFASTGAVVLEDYLGSVLIG